MEPFQPLRLFHVGAPSGLWLVLFLFQVSPALCWPELTVLLACLVTKVAQQETHTKPSEPPLLQGSLHRGFDTPRESILNKADLWSRAWWVHRPIIFQARAWQIGTIKRSDLITRWSSPGSSHSVQSSWSPLRLLHTLNNLWAGCWTLAEPECQSGS